MPLCMQLSYSSLSPSHYPLLALTDSHPRLVVMSAYSFVASVRRVFFGDRPPRPCCYESITLVSISCPHIVSIIPIHSASSSGTFTSVRACARPPCPISLEPAPFPFPFPCDNHIQALIVMGCAVLLFLFFTSNELTLRTSAAAAAAAFGSLSALPCPNVLAGPPTVRFGALATLLGMEALVAGVGAEPRVRP
jgi:hypothetical protein